MAVTVFGFLLFSCSSSKNYRFMGQTHVEDDRYFAIANETETNACFISGKTTSELIGEFDADPEYDGENIDRAVLRRNISGVLRVRFVNQVNTKIVCKISIDRAGVPVMAQLLPETTAIMDQHQKTAVLEGIMGYRYAASPVSPCIETGKLTIVLQEINAFNNN